MNERNIESDHAAARAAGPALELATDEAVIWTAYAPLLTNPVILRAAVIMLLATSLIVAIVFAIVAPAAIVLIPILIGGLAVLMAVICILLGNRLLMRYGLFEDGYASEIADRRINWISGTNVAAGALTQNPTLGGSGLVAQAATREFQPWARVDGVRFDPQRHRIGLHLGWRGWDILFCSLESYQAAADRLRSRSSP